MTWRHHRFFWRCFVSLVKFSYWSKFHVNIVTGSQIMTIFFCKGLTRSPEIRNTPVWVLPNTWRLGQVMDTKFCTNVSNRISLNAANFQGYSFYRFWVIKGKPTRGEVKSPPPLPFLPGLGLNPNFVLNSWVDVFLQSIITLLANFLSIKVLLDCFFGSSTRSYLWSLWSLSFLWCIFHFDFLQIFIMQSFFCMFFINRNILSFCCWFYTIYFIRFSAYINHIYIACSIEVLSFFIPYFITLYCLNTLFTETKLVMTNILTD